jgi:hypothetical protein
MADPVVAALVPLAFGLLLLRLRRPAAWMAFVFMGAYLVGGVFLAGHEPTYHRIAITLFYASLAVAWAARELAGAAAQALGLSAKGSLAAALAVAVASGVLSAHYYFREFPPVTHRGSTTGMGWLLCRYAGTHTVIDATTLDGVEYVPLHNVFPSFQCPSLHRIWCKSRADLWKVSKLTSARNVVLIVPERVVAETPGVPSGYRVVREFVDRSIKYPESVALRVYELSREGAAATDGTVGGHGRLRYTIRSQQSRTERNSSFERTRLPPL